MINQKENEEYPTKFENSYEKIINEQTPDKKIEISNKENIVKLTQKIPKLKLSPQPKYYHKHITKIINFDKSFSKS